MSGGPASLEALRQEIDEIDTALQELLTRRIEIAKRIGDAKGKNAAVALRPAREAAVLRRLLAANRGGLPNAVLVRIWREIFSASIAHQGTFSVAVYCGEDHAALPGLAREHFGVLTPIAEFGSPARVINAVAAGEASVGVISPLDTEAEDPWWRYLTRDAAGTPRIVARLPFAGAASPSAEGGEAALVIGLSTPEDSGNDRTYLSVETGEQVSRSGFKDLLVRAGMTVRETAMLQDDASCWLHLAEVEGFVAPKDPRLAELRRLGGERIAAVWVLGAYPVPLSDDELAESPAAR